MNELLFLVTIVLCTIGILIFYKYLGHDGLYLWIIIATMFSFIASFRTIPLCNFDVNGAFPILTSIYICIYILIEKYSKKDTKKVISVSIFTMLVTVFYFYIFSIYRPSIYDNISIYLMKLLENNFLNLILFTFMLGLCEYLVIVIYKYIKNYYNNTFVKNCLTTIVVSIIDTAIYLPIVYIGNDSINVIYVVLATYAFKLMASILYLPFVYYMERLKKVKK